MKVFLLTLNLLVYGGSAMAKVVVSAEGVDRGRPGNLIFFLFEKEGFPKDHSKAIERKQIEINEENHSVEFENLPVEFAIKILHDEDGDGEVGKNWTGLIPREGLGFSNNQKVRFGPPSFKSCVVNSADVKSTLQIKVYYP